MSTKDENPIVTSWEFAGWGEARKLTDVGSAPVVVTNLTGHSKGKLGQWFATAICGNDITSSCLYVAALSSLAAGVYAPIALVLVAIILFFFRRIYAEVGSALPLNGGTYTLLLNSTNKKFAAGAACLTLLSYIATAVISAGEAMHYAHTLWQGFNIFWATAGLLTFFAVLNLIGITESAVVALGIFVFHMATLTILTVAAGITVFYSTETLHFNWQLPHPSGVVHALFYGFAAAMLGISGFESSANFIEEQKQGVFPKTLRNMWIAVSIFNPLICFLALGLIPLDQMDTHKTNLLAEMGNRSAGPWLGTLVSIDAVLVLSGAVLTSYVGVIGLIRRMTLDRCLPQVLLAQNRWRGTNHFIILVFLLLCCSILVITEGEVSLLAGVYTLSFLSVMALFGIGNGLLKVVRARLPRAVRASWPAVILGVSAVIIGLIGNLTLENVKVFATYFGGVSLAVLAMFVRIPLLRGLLFFSHAIVDKVTTINAALQKRVTRQIDRINDMTVVYFTRGDDLATLNRAALYVLQNEQTRHMTVVHVYEEEKNIPTQLADHLSTVDHLYPRLRIDFLAVKSKFGPELIERMSLALGVSKNYMFIGTPSEQFPHRLDALGGVRLIL
jgi:amino acid transporter